MTLDVETVSSSATRVAVHPSQSDEGPERQRLLDRLQVLAEQVLDELEDPGLRFGDFGLMDHGGDQGKWSPATAEQIRMATYHCKGSIRGMDLRFLIRWRRT